MTLDDVKAAVPTGVPVGQNTTPDERRCNFTWEDRGNWGIDVALLRGFRADIESSERVPGGPDKLKDGTPYEPVAGLGEQAWAIGTERFVEVAVLRGSDAVIVDLVFDGTATLGSLTPLGLNADFLAVCKELATTVLKNA